MDSIACEADAKPKGRRKRPERATFVYFIQATTLGLIKIGCAVDPADRLYTLQIGSPDRLKLLGVIHGPDAFGLEHAFHRQFADVHSHGEWFQPDPDLQDLIAREAVDYDEWVSRGQAELLDAIMSRRPYSLAPPPAPRP